MDFSFREEQLAFKEEVLRFARRELSKSVGERDRAGEFDTAAFRKCAEFGIQGLPVPREYGGSGADPITVALAMEALGASCEDLGLLFSINAQMWSFELPLVQFGTEAQKRAYLPRICSGEIVAVHAITEPGSGSDAFSLRATAVKRGSRYVLNGTKAFITNAPIADVVIVFASVDREKGMQGVSAFLVEKGTRGFGVSREWDKLGLRTSPMGEVVLEDCEIPEENRLGREGAGVAIFNAAMEWERSAIPAMCVGAMERQLDACVRYARERRQFGKPIGRFQAVAHRIAEMKVRIETARWLVYRVAWLKQEAKPAVMDAAIAKLYVSEAHVKNSLDAIQIHGAHGYMTETGIARELRDAIGGTIYSGTADIQRNIIAAWLGLPKAE